MNSIRPIPKPIIKWLGGKTQLLDKLISEFPETMNNYHEIFVGGGSVLLAILTMKTNGKIHVNGTVFAYDANEALISLYKNIQSRPNELYDMIQSLIVKMNECHDTEIIRKPKTIEEGNTSKESYYYWVRHQYNILTQDEKNTLLGSSLFVFLNKTCFRGVFRLNAKGNYNVPFGHYKDPEIINRTHLLEISGLIRDVVFECCDFTVSLKRVVSDDFVYMDPPYAPENEQSFVGYTENGFVKEKHVELFKLSKELNIKNIRMIMSNADVELVHQNFPIEEFEKIKILCKRRINSKNPESKAGELFIKNYNIVS